MTHNNKLNQFFGKPGAQASLETKEQYGTQISKTIIDVLCGETEKKSININGRDFVLIEGGQEKATAEKQIKEMEEILESPVGHYLEENTQVLLKSHMSSRKKDIEKLGDEYNDYYSMNRADFLAKTNSIQVLEETIDLEEKYKGDNLVTKLVNISKKRLDELESKKKA